MNAIKTHIERTVNGSKAKDRICIIKDHYTLNGIKYMMLRSGVLSVLFVFFEDYIKISIDTRDGLNIEYEDPKLVPTINTYTMWLVKKVEKLAKPEMVE